MDFDRLLQAIADPTRRRVLDELAERDGQTLFELHVRLINWHGASLSRQALSKHLAALESAKLLRVERRWRSKHHFLERAPLRALINLWLRPLVELQPSTMKGTRDENSADERICG